MKVAISEICLALEKYNIFEKCHHEDTVTYLKKCHHEDTVIFDNGIKPHFVKVEATLGAYAHLDRRSAVFGERRFGAF